LSEEEEPQFCPYCGSEDNIEHLGKTEGGAYIMHCDQCDTDFLVRDVTGKVKVSVEVKEA